jgi:uncharacterized protein (DUF302 family)
MTRSVTIIDIVERSAFMTVSYGLSTKTHLPFEQAVAQVKEGLKVEGFGVLTEIDVQATMREKLGAHMEQYLILGACNPPLAYRALAVEPQIGLLLPCNVVLRESSEGCLIEAIDPEAMLSLVDNDAVATVAHEAKERLQRVIAALAEKVDNRADSNSR